MLIIRNKRCTKKYRVGGSGIFETAINVGQTAAKELAKATLNSAIVAAKDVAIKKIFRKGLTQKNKDILDNLTGGAIRIQDLVKGNGLKLVPF